MWAPMTSRACSRVSNSSRQTQRCLGFENQDSMKAWLSGSRWPPRRWLMPCSASRARKARLVNAVPLSVPSVSSPARMRRSATAPSMTAVASWARQRTSSAQPVISRVQQSIAAFRITPAVLGDPDRGHIPMPELIRAGDLEIARPPAAALRARGLQQPVLAHQPLHALAIDRSSRPTRGERRDHRAPPTLIRPAAETVAVTFAMSLEVSATPSTYATASGVAVVAGTRAEGLAHRPSQVPRGP